METPLLAGRDFNGNDTATSPKVAIVNESFVKKFLNGAKDAVGKQFRLWESPGKPEPYYSVVGVVKDSVYNDMHEPFVPVMYFPRTQIEKPGADATFLIRSGLGMTSLLNSVKNTIAGVNPEIDIQFKVLRTQIRGIYGVISYTVAKRTNEIGVRMALGAQRSGVIGLILGEVAVLIAIGVVVGAGLTFAGSKAASSLLFGLKARDPLTLGLAIAILTAIGFGASFIPARRATRVDPVVALRYE